MENHLERKKKPKKSFSCGFFPLVLSSFFLFWLFTSTLLLRTEMISCSRISGKAIPKMIFVSCWVWGCFINKHVPFCFSLQEDAGSGVDVVFYVSCFLTLSTSLWKLTSCCGGWRLLWRGYFKSLVNRCHHLYVELCILYLRFKGKKTRFKKSTGWSSGILYNCFLNPVGSELYLVFFFALMTVTYSVPWSMWVLESDWPEF